MKILAHNNFLQEIENPSNKILRKKIFKNLNNFETYFSSTSNFENNKIQKITIAKTNLYVFKIDPEYRLIFSAEYDTEHVLTVVLLEIVKHEDYERKVFKLINE